MKHLEKRILKCGCFSLLMALSTLASGCSPKVTPTFVPAPTHDTIVAYHYERDSISYRETEQYRPSADGHRLRQLGTDPTRSDAGFGRLGSVPNCLPLAPDTLYITRETERWRVKHDSIYIGRVDTIPVIREVEVTKLITQVPWYYRYPALAMYALLGAIVGLVIIKLTLKI